MKYQEHGERKRITNEEKLRETFPDTIFTFWRDPDDLFAGIRLSDGWLQADYDQMYKNSEPCEDCVSREAVLRINELHHGQMPNHINHQIWEEVKALPPVTPKHRPDKLRRTPRREGLTE